MAQYGRPDGEPTNVWLNDYSYIDEFTYNDSDYIRGQDNANNTHECSLSNVTDPTSSSGHTVRFRA